MTRGVATVRNNLTAAPNAFAMANQPELLAAILHLFLYLIVTVLTQIEGHAMVDLGRQSQLGLGKLEVLIVVWEERRSHFISIRELQSTVGTCNENLDQTQA